MHHPPRNFRKSLQKLRSGTLPQFCSLFVLFPTPGTNCFLGRPGLAWRAAHDGLAGTRKLLPAMEQCRLPLQVVTFSNCHNKQVPTFETTFFNFLYLWTNFLKESRCISPTFSDCFLLASNFFAPCGCSAAKLSLNCCPQMTTFYGKDRIFQGVKQVMGGFEPGTFLV